MKKGQLHKKYKLFILSVCCLIFILSVVGIFTVFQHRLDERFYTILTTQLNESTKEQKHRTELLLSNIHEMMIILQSTLESSESALSTNSWEVTIQNSQIQIDYLDAQQVKDFSISPKLSDTEKTFYDQLMAEQDVVTEPGTPLFTENTSLFAFLHPVFLDGNLSGVLRAQISLSMLTEENMDSVSFFQKVYVILVRPDGSIVYADTPYPDGQNFFSATLQGGIQSDEVEYIQRTFQENESKTISFRGKGNDYYMSWESLDSTDWRIVMFARSPDIVLQTTTILKGMILTGICLIALTALFCIALLYFLLRQKRQLETQQRRYDALAQFNDTLLFEYDVISDRMTFTPNTLERLALNDQCLKGISGEYYMKHLLHPDDREGIHESFPLSDIILGEIYYTEARFRCRDGRYNWFGCQFKSIETLKGCTSRVVGKLVDISNQREREQLLQQAALLDSLTGVYNRSAEAMIKNQLEKDTRGLLFMIDLDDFKTVNDTYGHAAGDALLTGVAQILREVFRPDDIIARVGGDEFIVFLSGTSNSKIAENKAAAIQKRMEMLYVPETEYHVSASIGAAVAPQNGTTYEALTQSADQAMYTIKQHSKKGFAFHNIED